jgi:hypothetical protein
MIRRLGSRAVSQDVTFVGLTLWIAKVSLLLFCLPAGHEL